MNIRTELVGQTTENNVAVLIFLKGHTTLIVLQKRYYFMMSGHDVLFRSKRTSLICCHTKTHYSGMKWDIVSSDQHNAYKSLQ